MAGSTPLLSNIHRTLPVLAELYQNHAVTATAAAASPLSTSTFPPEPANDAEGLQVLRFFSHELQMGAPALERWRDGLARAVDRRWGALHSDRTMDRGGSTTDLVQTQVGLDEELLQPVLNAHTERHSSSSRNSGCQWFRPREQDTRFLQDGRFQLHLTVSPFITLSPPGIPREGKHPPPPSPRPTQHAESSSFRAVKAIPAGMHVLSLPTDAVLFADPPPTADPLLSFFMHVEDLVGQLVAADEDPGSVHHGYVSYLKDSIVPARNLPFLSEEEVVKLVGATSAGAVESQVSDGAVQEHTALALWRFFHKDMQGAPLSVFLRDHLDKDSYAWWVSAVLSRRAGTASLIPVLDKLNHSPLPNCYYTMSSRRTVCGLDVFDNLLAGVPLPYLYEPYVHVFTIRDVRPGEELTLCYASAPEGLYKMHSPSSPGVRSPTADGATAAPGSPTTVGPMDAALQALFPPVDADGGVATCQRLLHPGRQHVDLPEGRSAWQMQWGWVPACDAVYSEADLRVMAALVAERRVGTRRLLFPMSAAEGAECQR